MRTSFSFYINKKTHHSVVESKSTPQMVACRPRRKKALFAGGALVCVLSPFLVVQIVLYRANLATARESFAKAPTLRSTDRLLILAPHCDDETLGAGGTIAEARRRGIPVRLVFLTNGDGSRSTQIAVDARQMRSNSFQQLAALRQKESVKAAKALGVGEKDVVFLGYPDGGTKELWQRHWGKDNLYRSKYTGADHAPYRNARTKSAPYCGQQVLADVQGALRDFRPTVVITTHPGDTHPDHQGAYNFARAALEQLHQETKEKWASDIHLFTFVIHHGVWPAPYGYNPQAALAPPATLMKTGSIWMQEPLDSSSRKAKKTALECYPSQLAFTPHYLRSFLRRNELFAVLPAQSVPAQTMTAKTEKDAVRPIVLDAARDSLWHNFVPSADLQSLTLLPQEKTAQTLTLRLQAAKPPSKRLHYRLWMHSISAQNVAVSRMEIRPQNGVWKAVLDNNGASKESQELTVRAGDSGFEIEVPRANFQGAALFSAESYLRNKRLDATGTGVLRIPTL